MLRRMDNGPDWWKRLDIVLKTIIASAGLWAGVLYHRAQSKADADQHRLDELRVVKEFLDPLTSANPDQRRMAAAVIGQLADEQLVFRLATALPEDERGAVLAVYGPTAARDLLGDQKQPPEVRRNARAALDALARGVESWSRPASFGGDATAPSPSPSPSGEAEPPKPVEPRPRPVESPSAKRTAAEPPPPTVAPSPPPPPAPPASQGFVYLGEWDPQNQVWLTHYFESADGKPLPSPHDLAPHTRLRVRTRTGAVYLRTDIPDSDGNNRPTKGVLHEHQEVIVEAVAPWKVGDSDTGFTWARVTTPR
jgi:hypothetical protein